MPETGTETTARVKELAKRRVFVLFSLFFFFALLGDMIIEGDMFSHALDEYVFIAIAAVVLIFIALNWKTTTVDELRKQHNYITGLFVIALIFQLYAFPAEIGDPADFGNEVPSLVGLIVILLNRVI
jgi:hypothetical protein